MKKVTLAAVAVLALVLGGCTYTAVPNQQNQNQTGGNTNTNPSQAQIQVVSPQQNEAVSGTYTVRGQAIGGWYFEATFPVSLTNENGDVLAQSYVTAQGEWMTENFVPFEGTIAVPATARGTGYVVFEKSNPSGLPENSGSFRVPVRFTEAEMTQVQIYFGNSVNNPNAQDCGAVYAVTRTIPRTATIGAATVRELLNGPTEAEKQQGFYTSINEGTALNKLTITNGVATVDFNEALDQGVGGSCRVASIAAQIRTTLEQFPAVNSVVITRNGSSEDVLQP